jgi:hypothetical protein
MILEIKLCINFDDATLGDSHNTLFRAADKAIQNAMGNGAFTAGAEDAEIVSWNVNMGWRSPSDDEEEPE